VVHTAVNGGSKLLIFVLHAAYSWDTPAGRNWSTP
jgi:hypothetical protein